MAALRVVAMTLCWVAALGVSAEVCVPDKVNEFSWAGCPPPWPPTYDMPASTIVYACNYSGIVDPASMARWGVVGFDWSGQKEVWANAKPMDCESRMVRQARAVKAINPSTKVWVYRNYVKALAWMDSVQEKLNDPAYAGWFVQNR